VRKRFLNKNVSPGAKGGQCSFHVVHRRGAHEDYIGTEFLEGLPTVIEKFSITFFTAASERVKAGIAKGKMLQS
jgi:hypothetical protein